MSTLQIRLTITAVLLAAAILPLSVLAQTAASQTDTSALEQRVKTLEARLNDLEETVLTVMLPQHDKRIGTLESDMRALEAVVLEVHESRLKALETKQQSNKVRAPFTVVDAKGAAIMTVSEGANRGAFVFSEASKGAKGVGLYAGEKAGVGLLSETKEVWLGEMEDDEVGVYIAGPGGEGDIRALMSYDKGFEVRKNHERVANLGVTEKGDIALRIYSPTVGPSNSLVAIGVDAKTNRGRFELREPSGTLLANIESIENKHGSFNVFDRSDTPVATLRADEKGNGFLSILNRQGQGIASLEQRTHGGLLQITDVTGEIMVQAGVLESRVGLVRVGPGAMPGGILGAALPGSYIMGKKP